MPKAMQSQRSVVDGRLHAECVLACTVAEGRWLQELMDRVNADHTHRLVVVEKQMRAQRYLLLNVSSTL